MEPEVLKTRTFAPEGWTKTPAGAVSPKFQQYMAEQSGAAPDLDVVDPEVKELAEFLSVVYLPAIESGGVKADPTRFQIHQPARLAEYLIASGWHRDAESQSIRHIPTPNAGPGDMGIHIFRDADGSWPDPPPEEFFDPDKIVVSSAADGSWIASHPCGAVTQGGTKLKAQSLMFTELEKRTEEAR